MRKHVSILLGGRWHDFDGFASAMRSLLVRAGYLVDVTCDFEQLLQLGGQPCDVVLSYTCLSREGDAGSGPLRMSDQQIRSLAAWVRSGGALLAAHAATVLGDSSPELGALIGGVFLSHPPPGVFTV
jgi:type 1 glutamine amidotransferase